MELDGPYYSMLNFFDRVGKLERIVNVSSLLVSTTRKPSDAKARRTYQYAPTKVSWRPARRRRSSATIWTRQDQQVPARLR